MSVILVVAGERGGFMTCEVVMRDGRERESMTSLTPMKGIPGTPRSF